MLNFLHDPIPITLSNVFTLVTDKNRRYHVTDDEQSLVLKAYEELNGDWEKMVEYMKDNVMRIPGDYMKKFKTNEYYQGASEKAAKKRLRRIVTENVKKVATGTPVNPPLPQATLSSTASLSGTATRSSTSVAPAEPASPTTAMATVIKDRKERYSKKITPEERRASAKFSYANDDSTTNSGDEEVLVEVKDKPTQNKRKKKVNGKEKAAKKAQKRHTEMCDRAMQMMDRIGRFLDNYESETSESE